MTPEELAKLHALIEKLDLRCKDPHTNTEELMTVINYLKMLQDLDKRLHGNWSRQ
jgi:hypothetical protein